MQVEASQPKSNYINLYVPRNDHKTKSSLSFVACCFHSDICKWLDVLVFSEKDDKLDVPSNYTYFHFKSASVGRKRTTRNVTNPGSDHLLNLYHLTFTLSGKGGSVICYLMLLQRCYNLHSQTLW